MTHRTGKSSWLWHCARPGAASDSHGADALMFQWFASIVAPSPLIVWQGNSIDCSITSLLHEEPSCQKRAMGHTPLLDFSHSKP